MSLFGKFLTLTSCLLISGSLAAEQSFPGAADKVTESIEGVDAGSAHYSGYLSSLNGVQLHYWFFESQSKTPHDDPLVLWMNGGPGCSSMLGALTELGPIRLERDGKVHSNEHSWTKYANILFLESPAGVGFSYNSSKLYENNDEITAKLNTEALRSFYEKFPHFKTNRFYITGESYGGIYIPTLATELMANNFTLSGIAIGNGMFDRSILYSSVPFYNYYHSMVDTQTFEKLLSTCCKNGTVHCRFDGEGVSHQCSREFQELQYRMLYTNRQLNPYNILDSCFSEGIFDSDVLSYEHIMNKLVWSSMDSDLAISHGNPLGGGHSPPCVDQTYIGHFLNKKEMKKALHISPSSPEWAPCRDINYHHSKESSLKNLKQIVQKGVRVLIFNGDADSVCNFLANSMALDTLGFPESGRQLPWLVNGQVAGFERNFSPNLRFKTVRGAGHMVPTDKPVQALAMFKEFLH